MRSGDEHSKVGRLRLAVFDVELHVTIGHLRVDDTVSDGAHDPDCVQGTPRPPSRRSLKAAALTASWVASRR
jgi:hypothetical protein